MQSPQGHFSVVQTLMSFLKTDNDFSSLNEFGKSSHIFGAKDERPSLPKWTVEIHFLSRIDALLRLRLLLANSNNKFRITGEILLLTLQLISFGSVCKLIWCMQRFNSWAIKHQN